MVTLTSWVQACQICVLFACVNWVVSHNTLQRSYDLNPVADTFIEDASSRNYRIEYLQLDRRSASEQSRILMSFDIVGFKKTSEWNLFESPSLNKTTLLNATLRLTSISGSLYNTVSASRVVRSWTEEVVTSTTRGTNGELWYTTFLETRGVDATPAIEENNFAVDDSKTMENFVFEIEMKEILEHWLENTASNHGLLLWIENTTSSSGNDILKFASTEHALLSFHPVINVVLEDEVFIKGNCTSDEFQCGDGSCISPDKRCNFIDDCLHGTDETTCGIDCGFETPCGWDSVTSEGAIGWKIGSKLLKEDFYMYVNGSQEVNETISELSQEFRDSNYHCKLHFDYYMSGKDVDSLEVVVIYNGTQHTVWTKAGNSGDSWQGDVLNIGKLEGAFEVIFRAMTGGTTDGIIALDDISFMDCGEDPDNIAPPACGLLQLTCSNLQCVNPSKVCDFSNDCLFGEDEDPSICGVMPEGSRCNFEDGLCGWWDIVGEDHFNWTRHHGKTPSSNTGPNADHTLETELGYYIYTEVTKQGNWHTAFIRSPWFRPPPPDVGNQTSEYYKMCQIRFYHHMFGENNARLRLYVIHNDTAETINQLFSETTSRYEVPWTLYEVALEYTTVSYYLQFEATKGSGYRGDVALDDISLSRECFTLDHLKQKTTVAPTTIATTVIVDKGSTPVGNTKVLTQWIPTQQQTLQETNSTQFEFSTCGMKGRSGPTQEKCDNAYQHSDVIVQVEDSGDEFIAGVQMWTVPIGGLYRITAKGASGGRGIESSQDSFGAIVMTTFNLTKGDVLYILVGQEGESACDEDDKLVGNHCDGLDDATREQYGPGGRHAGGGGGGGGASYVAMFNKTSGEWYPLVVAGGGGGLGFSDQKTQDGKNGGILDAGPGTNGLLNITARDTSGSGGGWSDNVTLLTSGRSFIQGTTGGQVCHAAYEDNRWSTSGGFGGGGGPCVSGGGGGGYTGGDACLTKDMKAYGFGGTSYTSSEATLVYKEIANHIGDGTVQVFATVSCDLPENLSPDFSECVDLVGSSMTTSMMNEGREGIKVKLIILIVAVHISIIVIPVLVFTFCYPPTTNLPPAHVGTTNSVIIIAVSIAVFLILSLLILLILCFYRRQSKKLKSMEEQIPAVQLAKLRENISVDVNPCYSFGDSSVSSSDLKELPRSQIKLVRALGEGAFGEVFEGTYNVNNVETRQIAVKTLPEVCTEQNETDFLLEAIIMSHFSHENIVHFIGVCFTQHPRFIILELMAGGELKQFLRDNRPVKDEPSKIRMLDLLHIAKDVAQGCCYLENKKFIHRDIAARNILLTSRSADRVAKIGDFGMARDIYGADYYRKSGRALLPVKWMPPEAFLDGIFTAKTDIWSFGVLLWEIMSLGYMPYPGMSNQEVIQFVTIGNRMSPPSQCPPQVYSLIEQCWSEIPEERPSSSLLLERIGYCLQDPDVLSTPLPKTIPQLNRQLTVNRPSENSLTLKVEKPSHLSSDLQSPTEVSPQDLQEDTSQLHASESNDDVFTRQDSLREYQFQFPQDVTYQYTSSNKMDAKQKQSLFYNRVYQYSASLGEEELNPLSQSFPRPFRRSVSSPEDNVCDPLSCSLNIPNRKSLDDNDVGSRESLGTNPFLPLVKKSSNPFTNPIKEHTSEEKSGLLEYANESTTSSNMSSVQGSSRSLNNSNFDHENIDGSEQSVDADGSVKLRERPRSRPGSRRGSAPRTNVRCSKTLSDVEIDAMCDPLKSSQTFSGNIGTNPRLSRNIDGCATFPRSNSRSSESEDTLGDHCSRKRSLRRQKNNEVETGQPSDTSVKSDEANQNNKPLMSPGRVLKLDQDTGMFLFGNEENATVV